MADEPSNQQLRAAFFRAMERRALTIKPWCEAAGVSPNTLYNYRNRRSDTLSSQALRKLAGAAGVSVDALFEPPSARLIGPGLMDSPQSPLAPMEFRQILEAPRDVPVLGVVNGSEEGAYQLTNDVIDYARRLPGIAAARNIYVVLVQESSMAPRYEPGEPVYVSKDKPVNIGDYVVVQTQESETAEARAMIKRLIRRNAEIVELEQFNPPKTIRLKNATVASIDKVLEPKELYGL